MLIAVALMLVGAWLGFLVLALMFNLVFWIVREWWQKVDPDGPHLTFGEAGTALFTFHVMLEWAAPMVVSVILYGVLR